MTRSDMESAGFITGSYLSEALDDFVKSSELSDYFSEALSDYVRSDEFGSYLSEVGAVTEDNFSSALGYYLSEYGGEVIYNAISQYINSEEE